MKKWIFTLILIPLFWIATLLTGSAPFAPDFLLRPAKAEGQVGDYACILKENTFFYATPDENEGLFLLPTTYYVKLLRYGERYSQVEYLQDDDHSKKLVGYVQTDKLTFVDYAPKTPYFRYEFTLSYRIEEADLSAKGFLDEITFTCAYYGDYKIGSKTYCYVLRGETFGYVPKPSDLTVPENTEYADYLAQQTPPTPPPDETPSIEGEGDASPMQIAILVALCLLVPVLSALILKPPKRPPYDLDGE